MPADVFISYSSNDQDRVVKLADKLRKAGVSIWVDESGIGAATLWSKEIAGAIKGCKVLILMVTPNSVKSKNVVREVSLASEQNKQILPVILEPTPIPEALEYHLAGIQHLDVTGMSAAESAEDILPPLQRLLGMESENVNAVVHGNRNSGRRPSNIWADWRLYASILIAVAVGWFIRPTPELPELPAPPVTIHVEQVLNGLSGLNIITGNGFALSPDGKKLVYAHYAKESKLRLLSLTDGADIDIPGTEGGRHPFFSPDGQSIGFATETKLKTVSLVGGGATPVELIDNISSGGRGASWGEDSIVYSRGPSQGLWAIDATGSNPEPLTELKPGEATHRWPQWLPGGKHVIAMVSQTGNIDAYDVHAIEVDTGFRTVLRKDCTYARYVDSGHLLFADKGNLNAQELDLEKLKLKGRPALVLRGEVLITNTKGAVQYSASDEGTLVYLTEGRRGGVHRKFLWVDLQGQTELASNTTGEFRSFDLSPNGNTVALRMDNNIHLLDLKSNLFRQLTLGGENLDKPVWAADGQSILFTSNREGKWGIWRKRTDFSREAQLVIPKVAETLWLSSSTSDGKMLTGFAQRQGTGLDAWVLRLGQPNSELEFISVSSANERQSRFSKDGQWLVYTSGSQMYVKRYDGDGAIQPLHTEGLSGPRWSTKEDKIFYANHEAIWSIEMTVEGESITPGISTRVVKLPPYNSPYGWDISSDEKRFLVLVDDGENEERPASLNSVNIVFNWFTELNEKVPVGKE